MKKIIFILSTLIIFIIVFPDFLRKNSKEVNESFEEEHSIKDKKWLSSIYYDHIEEFLL